MKSKFQYLFGIDPGTMTSGTGLSLFAYDQHFNRWSLDRTGYIEPVSKTDLRLNIRHMANIIKIEFKNYMHHGVMVAIEEPFLMGKANKNILKLFGALEYVLFDEKYGQCPIQYINPATVKKHMLRGDATKHEVLKSVMKHLNLFDDFIFTHNRNLVYDKSDAAAIAITYLKMNDLWVPHLIEK